MSSSTAPKSTSTLFRNGLLFDGSGATGRRADLLVKDGRVAEIADSIGTDRAEQVIDCTDKWVTPGLIDIHTHLDLEVELAPELPEVVRHGTTTVVMSNCSLGVAYGNQRKDGQDRWWTASRGWRTCPSMYCARWATRWTGMIRATTWITSRS